MKQKKLKKLLHYNTETGVFTRKKTTGSRAKKGDVCGAGHPEGYLTVMIKDRQYLQHRLAWFYVHGYFPENIDHINHDRKDNRLCNLREVTRTENQRNMSKNKRNTSGVTGVSWDKATNKWAARIKGDNKYVFLGTFVKFSDAVDARKNAEVLYGYHENHGGL